MTVIVFLGFPHTLVTLALGKGHRHWYALKGLAKEYHLAKFHDYRHDNVRKNAIVAEFPRFPIRSCDLGLRSLKLACPERLCHRLSLC